MTFHCRQKSNNLYAEISTAWSYSLLESKSSRSSQGHQSSNRIKNLLKRENMNENNEVNDLINNENSIMMIYKVDETNHKIAKNRLFNIH